MAQNGSCGPTTFQDGQCGSIFLLMQHRMALYGCLCCIWLNKAQNGSYFPQNLSRVPIWLPWGNVVHCGFLLIQKALYGSSYHCWLLRVVCSFLWLLWLQMALYGSNCYIGLDAAPYGSCGPTIFRGDQYGSLWLIWVYSALYGSLWLKMANLAQDGSIWLIWVHSLLYGFLWHICLSWLNMAYMDYETFRNGKYGSLWPIGVTATFYSSLWLHMALYGSYYYIWLDKALYGSDGSLWLIGLFMAHTAL